MKSNGKQKKLQLEKLRALAGKLAADQGLRLYDFSIDQEQDNTFYRVYIDRDGGVTLDECEKYHRALIPLVEDYDYDYLEVSSPGIDRVLKFRDDIERNIGQPVEVKLYKAVNGAKSCIGRLLEMGDTVRIDVQGQEMAFDAAAVAQVRLHPSLEELEDDSVPAQVIDEA